MNRSLFPTALLALLALTAGPATLGCSSGSSGSIALAANASGPVTVQGLFFVPLDGTASTGPVVANLAFQWVQLSGPGVSLANAGTAVASFVAPDDNLLLTFELTVTDTVTALTDTDTVSITVQATSTTPPTQLLGFTGGDASGSAFHTPTQRLFVLDAPNRRIQVYDLSDPSMLVPLGALDLVVTFSNPLNGLPSAIAVSGGVVAVTLCADPTQDPGGVQFFDANGLVFINQVLAGPDPSGLAFTPDGAKLLVTNEGTPDDDYLVDPEGSVTLMRIPPGGPAFIDPFTDVSTLSFNAFDGMGAQLAADGVRLFGPGASVSQDLEPEFVAVTSDSTKAYVSCQENNALAIVDLTVDMVTVVVGFGLKDFDASDQLHAADLTIFALDGLPELGTTAAGDSISLGGFAALDFEGTEGDGTLTFATVPARGPVLDPFDFGGDGSSELPFALPDYQARIVRFAVDSTTGAFEILEEVPLSVAAEGVGGGGPITGVPNLRETSANMAFQDEVATDLMGVELPLDAFGASFGGLVVHPDGSFWLADEYRPSLYHFDSAGILIERFVPLGSNAFGVNVGTEDLPAVYAQRRVGKGFTGLALDESTNRLYAWTEGALDNPDTATDIVGERSRTGRVLEFDVDLGTTTGEFVYLLDRVDGAAVFDAAWAGTAGEFLVTEGNSVEGAGSVKNVYRVSIAAATNLQDLSPEEYAFIAGPGGLLEGAEPTLLDDIGIDVVAKKAFVNLAAEGYVLFGLPTGLALLDDGALAVLNDNQYGLAGAALDPATGDITFDTSANAAVGLATFLPLRPGLDASDVDQVVNIESWPVRGILQPDHMVTFEVDGEVFIATANEGKARVLGGTPGFIEPARVASLVLDPADFPDAANIQLPDNVGRLNVSMATGDVDGDGMFDELHAFGGRSFAIYDVEGKQVFESGSLLERLTVEIDATRFNSEGDSSTFDMTSDDRGVRPGAITAGVIGGTPFLFVGLVNYSGVMVFNAANPASPSFVTYLDPVGQLEPTALEFVPAGDSPNQRPLLLVSYERSASLGAYAIDF